MAGRQSPVQYDVHAKSLEVDIPGLDQRIEERHAVRDRDMENIRIQELEDGDPHLFIAALAQASHQAEPLFTVQFLSCDSLGHFQDLLRHQAFQFSEWLLLKDCQNLLPFPWLALAKYQLPKILEQRARRVRNLLFELLPPLQTREL